MCNEAKSRAGSIGRQRVRAGVVLSRERTVSVREVVGQRYFIAGRRRKQEKLQFWESVKKV